MCLYICYLYSVSGPKIFFTTATIGPHNQTGWEPLSLATRVRHRKTQCRHNGPHSPVRWYVKVDAVRVCSDVLKRTSVVHVCVLRLGVFSFAPFSMDLHTERKRIGIDVTVVRFFSSAQVGRLIICFTATRARTMTVRSISYVRRSINTTENPSRWSMLVFVNVMVTTNRIEMNYVLIEKTIRHLSSLRFIVTSFCRPLFHSTKACPIWIVNISIAYQYCFCCIYDGRCRITVDKTNIVCGVTTIRSNPTAGVLHYDFSMSCGPTFLSSPVSPTTPNHPNIRENAASPSTT